MSTVVPPPSHLFLCCHLDSAAWGGHTTGHPSPATPLDVDTTRQKKLSLQPQLYVHGLSFERENTNIYSFFKSWGWLIPVVLQSKVWVCSCFPAGIVGSNPPRDMTVCLVWVLCAVRGFCSGPVPHFLGILPSIWACMRESRCKNNTSPTVCS